MTTSSVTNDDKHLGNERKAITMLVLALFSLLWIVRQSVPLTASESRDNEQQFAVSKVTPLVDSADLSSNRGPMQQNQLATKDLPIYLLQATTKNISLTKWGDLVANWDRETQYTDLIGSALDVPSLPVISSEQRPTVMIHCGPKSGSTTLRSACKTNLLQTCGVPKQTSKYPVGYMDIEKLYPLIDACTNTSHFCAKNVTMPMDVPTFDDRAFIHMFPFRNYDEWAKSALKQAYDRGRETGCQKAEMLLNRCKPSIMELDFRKYGKTDLSMFKELVVQRMNEKNENHIFLLYYHRELNDVLSLLSEMYDIPLLPGSNGHGKDKRPEGTCDDELLDKFHSCFSSELMDLN